MRWTQLPIVAFDVETTGLRPLEGDRIIEVGLVRLDLDETGTIVGRSEFGRLINPECPIPREVTKITGITDDDVREAPLFADIADEVLDFLDGALFVAHNLVFDRTFLVEELARIDQVYVEPLASVDTLAMYTRHAPKAERHRLSEFAAAAGVPLLNAHRATGDAEATARALVAWAALKGAPAELDDFLEWAHGVGRPPADEGVIGVDACGAPIFLTGEYAGQPVITQLVHLQWYLLARVKRPDGVWDWRVPPRTRRWAAMFLNASTAGRKRPTMAGVQSSDWALDSCVAARPTPADEH